MNIPSITAHEAKEKLAKGEAVLVDVREPAEHRAHNIPEASLCPSGTVCSGALPKTDKAIIIHCQKGMRGANACTKLLGENAEMEVYNLEGGIEAWHAAGLPTEQSGKTVLPLNRQVQLTIGVSVLTLSLLAYFVHPAFALGAAFFGAGLTNAGLTGWCGLGLLIAKMPWNR